MILVDEWIESDRRRGSWCNDRRGDKEEERKQANLISFPTVFGSETWRQLKEREGQNGKENQRKSEEEGNKSDETDLEWIHRQRKEERVAELIEKTIKAKVAEKESMKRTTREDTKEVVYMKTREEERDQKEEEEEGNGKRREIEDNEKEVSDWRERNTGKRKIRGEKQEQLLSSHSLCEQRERGEWSLLPHKLSSWFTKFTWHWILFIRERMSRDPCPHSPCSSLLLQRVFPALHYIWFLFWILVRCFLFFPL